MKLICAALIAAVLPASRGSVGSAVQTIYPSWAK